MARWPGPWEPGGRLRRSNGTRGPAKDSESVWLRPGKSNGPSSCSVSDLTQVDPRPASRTFHVVPSTIKQILCGFQHVCTLQALCVCGGCQAAARNHLKIEFAERFCQVRWQVLQKQTFSGSCGSLLPGLLGSLANRVLKCFRRTAGDFEDQLVPVQKVSRTPGQIPSGPSACFF